jgi:hypothetical protein
MTRLLAKVASTQIANQNRHPCCNYPVPALPLENGAEDLRAHFSI